MTTPDEEPTREELLKLIERLAEQHGDGDRRATVWQDQVNDELGRPEHDERTDAMVAELTEAEELEAVPPHDPSYDGPRTFRLRH
jgi:hypothetical protein